MRKNPLIYRQFSLGHYHARSFLLRIRIKGTMCAAIQVWNVLRNIVYLGHQIA